MMDAFEYDLLYLLKDLQNSRVVFQHFFYDKCYKQGKIQFLVEFSNITRYTVYLYRIHIKPRRSQHNIKTITRKY